MIYLILISINNLPKKLYYVQNRKEKRQIIVFIMLVKLHILEVSLQDTNQIILATIQLQIKQL